MSFFGNKNKDKDALGKKSQFYVEFLGWMEARGLRGPRYTDTAIRELRRRHLRDKPPKLTIQVNKKDLKITQDVEEEKKKRKIKNIKFPTIRARDITYAVQATRSDGLPDDVVACIYLGFMPRTRKYVHVHVYRFDSPSTATTFTRLLTSIIQEHAQEVRKVEMDLLERGEIDDPRLMPPEPAGPQHISHSHNSGSDSAAGSNYSGDEDSPTFGSDEMDPDLESLADFQPFDCVADELKHRLTVDGPPLLLPPRDYDTVHRQRGNLKEVEKRRCLQLNIVGMDKPSPRERNGSGESGVELPSPSTESESSKNPDTPPESAISTTPPHLREFVYPPSTRSPKISPPMSPARLRHDPFRSSGSGGGSNPPSRTGSGVFHGRQASQSSTFSNHSIHSEGSRTSQHSDPADDVIIYRGSREFPAPPADYEESLTRPRQQPGMTVLTQSMPAGQLRRHIHSHSGPPSPSEVVYSPRFRQHLYSQDSARPMSAGPEDARMRRVNSMYR